MLSAMQVGHWPVEFLNGYERDGFRKSGDHLITNERSLLKILKFFSLAKFPNLQPEISAYNGGRIDFGFDDLGLEIVVKNKLGAGNPIVGQNASEMVKLRKFHGRSCLAPIDMEKDSNVNLDRVIAADRGHSLVKGNHAQARPTTILAIARGDEHYDLKKYNLRASK